MEEQRWKRGEHPSRVKQAAVVHPSRFVYLEPVRLMKGAACPGRSVAYQASAQGKLRAVLTPESRVVFPAFRPRYLAAPPYLHRGLLSAFRSRPLLKSACRSGVVDLVPAVVPSSSSPDPVSAYRTSLEAAPDWKQVRVEDGTHSTTNNNAGYAASKVHVEQTIEYCKKHISLLAKLN